MFSKVKQSNPIKYFSIQDANLFSCLENYEVEMEIDNSKVGPGTEYNSVDSLVKLIKQTMRFVLSGLQGTNYPISKVEMNDVIRSYINLIHGKKANIPDKITPKNFIGYSSSTLQYVNLVKNAEDMNAPNIRDNYTVTDKADGERSLLFISEKGKVYFIDSNMKVKFTGCFTDQKALYNTLLDGEYIEHNKNRESINLFACFDLYYLKGEDKRRLPLVDETITVEDVDKNKKGRLTYLRQYVLSLKMKSITGNDLLPMRIEVKHFEVSNKSKSIFNCCDQFFIERLILSRVNHGLANSAACISSI